MSAITQAEANAAYRAGNDRGEGYAPYADVPGDDSVADAVAAAGADGWEVELRPDNTSDVVVLRNADGDLLAIGGDAVGHGAWAVIIHDAARRGVAR